MSLFVLDTDTLSLLRTGQPQVIRRMAFHAMAGLAVSSVSVEEALGGWYTYLRRARRPDDIAWAHRELAETVILLAQFVILTLTETAQARYDQLHAARLNVRGPDLRIAAIALENNAVVVTRNLRDFQRVPGLTVEDWSV
jgi:tRNA(fMet)-specific endonuclease VapC